jgi:hypothetical protein
VELRDFIVTPIVLLMVYALAYWIRPRFTDINTRRYFIPALTVKIIGAIAVGFVYQFYYGGGDTFNFHTRASRVIWKYFINDPFLGLNLIFKPTSSLGEFFEPSQHILFYNDSSSFFVIRVSAFIDIFTFSSYSATACFFAAFAFSGLWLLFLVFYRQFNIIHFQLAIVILFLPSVIFWGSGLLKDTLTIGAIGWLIYGVHIFFIKKQKSVVIFFTTIIAFLIIFFVKIYILICLIPAIVIWLFAGYSSKIKSMLLKIMIVPIMFIIVIILGFLSVQKIVEDDNRYAIDKLAKTAQITAYDIGFYTGRNAGSGYSLGELDGSYLSIIKLFPAAINTTLFRPYLWEVNNPLMFISAIESFIILFFTLYVFFKVGLIDFVKYSFKPYPFFCFVFAITFAFAVGVSTFNFGTLVRYKIPMMPFYLCALLLILNYWKSAKKLSFVAETE